jgi:hypothetical protein
MKLIIKKSEWLRGEGSTNSYLLRASDQKRCCVGIYCRALGVPDEAIRLRQWISNRDNELRDQFPDLKWLDDSNFPFKPISTESIYDSVTKRTLGEMNDEITPNYDRESAITRVFAKNGVEVTFED